MRTLAIGDIHGCLTALTTLLKRVRLQADDTLITLGDYVDRGPDSKGVLDFLINLSHECQLVHLGGNHELMMLDAKKSRFSRHGWLGVGGAETIDSYGESMDDVPQAHWDFINSSAAFHETDTHIFVHANLNPKKPLSKQQADDLFWRPFGAPKPHISGKAMICGHTSQHSGLPKHLGHATCIDTYVYGDGWLTCLDVDSGHYWQANEEGGYRESNLAKLLEEDTTSTGAH